jgi:conjugal transfer pilus assembly protein TraW
MLSNRLSYSSYPPGRSLGARSTLSPISILGLLLILLGASSEPYATVIDHGVYGELFPVAEEDLREVFKARLRTLSETGRIAKLEAEFKTKAEFAAARPTAVANLNPTTEERTFTHDPTLTIENTITDHLGNILAKAGDKINPLDFVTPHKGLLFIDGDVPAQVTWAKEHRDLYHTIVTNGAPAKLTNTIGAQAYFDQGGHITAHYGIKQIPARIEQQGKLLQVSEFKIEATP